MCRVVNLAADQLWLGNFPCATTHDINACNFYSALQSTALQALYASSNRRLLLGDDPVLQALYARSNCPSVRHICQSEGMQMDAVFNIGYPVSLFLWCQEWLFGDDPV